ncbi:MAG: hypothetical protein IJC77_05645 [Bacteroidaceae bacterium]|nr:hypothetical protein [Bacteroidaceae bacterium]
MANKRDLKKGINYVISELFLECIVLKQLKKADSARADEILADILYLQSEFLSRAGHPEPGCVKKYYRKLSEDFLTEADNIVRRMQAM